MTQPERAAREAAEPEAQLRSQWVSSDRRVGGAPKSLSCFQGNLARNAKTPVPRLGGSGILPTFYSENESLRGNGTYQSHLAPQPLQGSHFELLTCCLGPTGITPVQPPLPFILRMSHLAYFA